MADLNVTVGADISQYNAAMQQAGQSTASFSNDVTRSLSQAAAANNQLGGSAMSTSMRFMQMRSGISAARDGVMAFTLGGQAAERSLMAMGHHINSLVNETGSFSGAMGAMATSLMGPGGIILGLTLAVELFSKYKDAQKKATEEQSDFQKSVEKLSESTGDELAHLSLLYAAAQDDTLSRQARLKAVKELQEEYPSYFGNLDKEAIMAGKAASAYDSLTQSIINSAIVKAGQDQLGGQFKQLIELQTLAKETQLKLDEANKAAELHPSNTKMFSNVTTSSQGFRDVGANATSSKPVVANSFVYDKEQQDLKSLDEYKKSLEEKIKATQQAVSDMVSQFGIDTLLEKRDKKDKKAPKDTSKGAVFLDLLSTNLETEQKAEYDAKKYEKKFVDTIKEAGKNGLKEDDIIPIRSIDGTGGKNVEKNLKTITSGTTNYVNEQHRLYAALLLSEKAQRDFNNEQENSALIAQNIGQAFTQAWGAVASGSQTAVSAVVSALEQMIVKLVEAAAEAAVVAGILSLLSGGSTSFISELLGSKGSGSGGILKSITGFTVPGHADGGITLKPHLAMVGEGGENEVIAPLSKLKNMMGNMGGGSGGNFSIEHRIKGNDLIVLLNRTAASNSRRT